MGFVSVGQLLNHPLYFMYSFLIGQIGADWMYWIVFVTQGAVGGSKDSKDPPNRSRDCCATPASDSDKKFGYWVLVAIDWIGFALFEELVYTRYLWLSPTEVRSLCIIISPLPGFGFGNLFFESLWHPPARRL